jgi:PAS domain S-box-containing protein
VAADEEEDTQLRLTALKNAESILIARQRAEEELLEAKEALERKSEELRQQREWFRVTLASIGDAVITTDVNGHVTFLNPIAEHMTGWALEAARGKPLDEIFLIVNEDTQQPAENPVEKVLASGTIVELANHTALIARDGTRIAIEDSAAPIRDASGKISGAVMVFHDVTRRRHAETALRASEERFRATFSQAAIGIAIAGLDRRFREANGKFADILGYTPDELRGLTFFDLTHPDDVGETEEQLRQLMAREIPYYALEKRYVRKDGATVWSSTTVTLLRDSEGKPTEFVGIIEDITSRKQIEAALREETRVLEHLNTTGKAIAGQLDLQALVQSVTDATTQLSGAKYGAFFYNVTNQQGESFVLFTLSGAPREAFEKFGLPRNTPIFNPTFRGEGVVRSADITRDPRYGTMAPHHGMPKGHLPVRSYLAVPVRSRSGEVVGGLFFGHPDPDVFTERAERLAIGVAAQAAVAIDNARLFEAAQREIASRERAEAALRETDRRKDEFLATLAHELRNPLAPIRQAAQISKAATATEAQKRWSHDVISRQVHHMSLLLDDLLDISRITRGTLELRTETTELAAVIDAAVETARPAIDAKRHVFSIDMPTQPVHFAADPLRLAQVLSNLLTNAAKYTDPEGRIWLSAQCTANTIDISVRDTGIGIPAEATARVFEMFSQVKAGKDRSEGGLGIGLALARGLIELHGGTLDARSAGSGHGSEFMVRLPRRSIGALRREESVAEPKMPFVSRRVLIADDNQDAAESLAMLLRMEGHEVDVVNDGRAALTAFSTFQPEVALLDIGMPEMSGYEVAREVRKGSLGRAVALIAVTGWGQDSDKAQALAAGFNHHFTKPVEPERLIDLLRSDHLHGPGRDPPGRSVP